VNNNANRAAFPYVVDITGKVVTGLTKREAFAMAAMQGFLGEPGSAQYAYDIGIARRVAQCAVLHADSLLEELAKPQP